MGIMAALSAPRTMLAPHQLDSAATAAAATTTGMNFPTSILSFFVFVFVSVPINLYERPFFPSLICLFLLPIPRKAIVPPIHPIALVSTVSSLRLLFFHNQLISFSFSAFTTQSPFRHSRLCRKREVSPWTLQNSSSDAIKLSGTLLVCPAARDGFCKWAP